MNTPETVSADFSARDFARVLFRHRTFIVWVISVSVLVVGLYSYLVLPTFEADAKILLVGQNETPIPMAKKLDSYRPTVEIAATQTEVVKSYHVLNKVVEELGLHLRPDPAGFRGRIYVIIDRTVDAVLKGVSRIKGLFIRIFTGRFPEKETGSSKFDSQVKRLMSKKVLSVKPVERTDVIEIAVYDYEPRMAAKIANAVALVYMGFNQEMQLEDLRRVYREEHPRIMKIKENIADLKAQIGKQEVRVANPVTPLSEESAGGEIKLMQRAVIPMKPVKPKKLMNLGLAFGVSAFFSIAFAFLTEAMDQSLRTPKDTLEVLGSKPLASLPYVEGRKANEKSSLFWDSPERSGIPQGFRTNVRVLISQILLMKKEKGFKSFVMVSAEEGAGKSTLSYHLASELTAHTREKILLIDADLRGPRHKPSCLRRWINTPVTPGLSDMLDHPYTLEDLVKVDPQTKINFITAGERDVYPEAVFALPEIKNLLQRAQNEFDFVLVDTPALKDHPDGMALAGFVDAAIFVIHSNETRRQVVQNFFLDFKEKNVPIVGAVMNFRQFEIPEAVYKRL